MREPLEMVTASLMQNMVPILKKNMYFVTKTFSNLGKSYFGLSALRTPAVGPCISGQGLCCLRINRLDNVGNLQHALGNLLGVSSLNLRAVLPDAQVLGSMDPSMHVDAIISTDLNTITE